MRMRPLLLPALALSLAAARPAAAQRPDDSGAPPRRSIPAPRWRASLGAASSATWAEVAGGVTVTTRPAAALGVAALWTVRPATRVTLGLRASASGARLEGDGNARSADAVTVADLALGAERELGGRLLVGAGVGAVIVRGPAGLAPFDAASAASPGAHATLALRATRRGPLALALTAQAFRYGATTIGSRPTEPGGVTRLLLEVRHGW